VIERWEGHLACMEKRRNEKQILAGKNLRAEGKHRYEVS
jgi:hypothetical protein